MHDTIVNTPTHTLLLSLLHLRLSTCTARTTTGINLSMMMRSSGQVRCTWKGHIHPPTNYPRLGELLWQDNLSDNTCHDTDQRSPVRTNTWPAITRSDKRQNHKTRCDDHVVCQSCPHIFTLPTGHAIHDRATLKQHFPLPFTNSTPCHV